MMFSSACFQHRSFQLGSNGLSLPSDYHKNVEDQVTLSKDKSGATIDDHHLAPGIRNKFDISFKGGVKLGIPNGTEAQFESSYLPLYLLLGCGVTRGLLKKNKKKKNRASRSRTSSTCTDLVVYKEFDFQKELRGIRIHKIPVETLLCIQLKSKNYISDRQTRIFYESFQVQKLEAAIGLHVYESAAAFEVQQLQRYYEEAQDEISLGIFYYRTVGEEPLLLTNGIGNEYETSQLLAQLPRNLTNDGIHKVVLVFYVGVIALVKFISYISKASILGVKSGLKTISASTISNASATQVAIERKEIGRKEIEEDERKPMETSKRKEIDEEERKEIEEEERKPMETSKRKEIDEEERKEIEEEERKPMETSKRKGIVEEEARPAKRIRTTKEEPVEADEGATKKKLIPVENRRREFRRRRRVRRALRGIAKELARTKRRVARRSPSIRRKGGIALQLRFETSKLKRLETKYARVQRLLYIKVHIW